MSLDHLFNLMVEKIQELKILRSNASVSPMDLKQCRDEIKLIQELITSKKAGA